MAASPPVITPITRWTGNGMSTIDTARMCISAAGGAGRLLLDALGDFSGISLPFRPGDVVTPRVLTDMINRGALPPVTAPVEITGVEVQDIPSVSNNCQNLVLSIQ